MRTRGWVGTGVGTNVGWTVTVGTSVEVAMGARVALWALPVPGVAVAAGTELATTVLDAAGTDGDAVAVLGAEASANCCDWFSTRLRPAQPATVAAKAAEVSRIFTLPMAAARRLAERVVFISGCSVGECYSEAVKAG